MTAVSICIPTFERPALLERALRSVIDDRSPIQDVEIVVSDDSRDDRSALVCERLFATWPGTARRLENRPGLGMVANFNRCVAEAAGRYVLILHDDDYLLPGAIRELLSVATDAPGEHPVTLFGVEVVDAAGRLRRRQSVPHERYVPHEEALTQVLSNSSYVRFPGILVAADAYAAVGPFDTALGGATDLEMWIRLFARYGVNCVPATISAYSVHDEAHTAGMFNRETIATLVAIFARVVAQERLPNDVVRGCESDFLAQFILGGAFRQLRAGDRDGARRVLALFDLPEVVAVGGSRRWRLVRRAMFALVRAPGPLALEARWLERLYPATSSLWPR